MTSFVCSLFKSYCTAISNISRWSLLGMDREEKKKKKNRFKIRVKKKGGGNCKREDKFSFGKLLRKASIGIFPSISCWKHLSPHALENGEHSAGSFRTPLLKLEQASAPLCWKWCLCTSCKE